MNLSVCVIRYFCKHCIKTKPASSALSWQAHVFFESKCIYPQGRKHTHRVPKTRAASEYKHICLYLCILTNIGTMVDFAIVVRVSIKMDEKGNPVPSRNGPAAVTGDEFCKSPLCLHGKARKENDPGVRRPAHGYCPHFSGTKRDTSPAVKTGHPGSPPDPGFFCQQDQSTIYLYAKDHEQPQPSHP